MKRRNLLTLMGTGMLAGCSRIGQSKWFGSVVESADDMHRFAQRTLGFRKPELAPEFPKADISPFFRGNGTIAINTPAYQASKAQGFSNWQVRVSGLVAHPMSLSLADIKALPQRTQITRHDCVEGWSAIGQWTGPQLSEILHRAVVLPEARFIVFHCADRMGLDGTPYYESCDLDSAFHPQTIVAHMLNGEPLPERNGAPLRMRLERQLGYKSAKYLTGIEAVASFAHIEGGKGGYWEDSNGYQWYAGI